MTVPRGRTDRRDLPVVDGTADATTRAPDGAADGAADGVLADGAPDGAADGAADPAARAATDREAYVEAVLRVVEAIPAGRVRSYGDIADAVGRGGPRQVGWVMSHYGGAVPWWRVVHADGRPADCHGGDAVRRLRAEGAPFRQRDPGRLDMSAASAAPAAPALRRR